MNQKTIGTPVSFVAGFTAVVVDMSLTIRAGSTATIVAIHNENSDMDTPDEHGLFLVELPATRQGVRLWVRGRRIAA